MKYKKMTVWSGGNKNAKTAKQMVFVYSQVFIALFLFYMTTFIYSINKYKNGNQSLVPNILLLVTYTLIFGFIEKIMFTGVKDSLKDIKNNKLITLYLYTIDNFVRIGEIPEDKFILFLDERGVVLAEKRYEDESRSFSFGVNDFDDFKYCEKEAERVEEITLQKEKRSL